MQPMKRITRQPKKVQTKTPPGNDIQKLGPAETNFENGMKNGPQIRPREQRRSNEEMSD